jgi:hypothetical protein
VKRPGCSCLNDGEQEKVSKIFAYPRECQEYLREEYGIRSYSDRHLKKMIDARIFPTPFEISPRRKGLTQEQLDTYAAEIIARAKI